jgi:hypothetical protein
MNITLGKRALRNPLEGAPPSKRARKNGKPIGVDGNLVFSIPECVCRIFSKLTLQDLLAFEGSAKRFSAHTYSAWSIFLMRRGFPTWLACNKEENNVKWSFILSKALNDFVIQLPLFGKKNDHKIELINSFNKYEGLCEKFPELGSFIKINLINRKLVLPVVGRKESEKQKIPHQEILENMEGSFDTENYTEIVGETLLSTLHKIDACMFEAKSLIYDKHRLAGFGVLERLKQLEPEIIALMDARVFSIGIIAITILKKYRLEMGVVGFAANLIEHATTRKDTSVLNWAIKIGIPLSYHEYLISGSFMSQIGPFLPKAKKQKKDGGAPVYIREKANIVTFFHLVPPLPAPSLPAPFAFDQFMKTFKERNLSIPCAFLDVAMVNLIKEKRWAEADQLVPLLIASYDEENHPPQINILKCAIYIKLQLEDFAGADNYLTQILNLDSCKDRFVLRADAIDVKIKLGQWEAGNNLCDEFIRDYFKDFRFLSYIHHIILFKELVNKKGESQFFSDVLSIASGAVRNRKKLDAILSTKMFTEQKLPSWLLEEIANLKNSMTINQPAVEVVARLEDEELPFGLRKCLLKLKKISFYVLDK